MTISQHGVSRGMHDSFRVLRDEIETKMLAIHQEIDDGQALLEVHIQENIKVLRELGTSEATLERIINKMMTTPLEEPRLPPLNPRGPQPVPTDIMNDINTSFAPIGQNESREDFNHRATTATASRRRTMSAFALDANDSSTARPQQAAESQARMNPGHRSIRFEDPGSVSSIHIAHPSASTILAKPGSRNDLSILGDMVHHSESVLEEYHAENDRKITEIIDRQLGEAFDVPTRVRAPKLINPPPPLLGRRERPAGLPAPPRDHHHNYGTKDVIDGKRIIMTASKAFDAVRYKAEDGPEKLMDDLIAASRRMREPMPDFIIRQRFMKQIPKAIKDLLTMHRGLSAEYSQISALRFHANFMWDNDVTL
ncbi:hypothetical protein C8R44DRAFT_753184 [Mycena epipterygia]|nr:hypothetical protein C8R44DRAFT_753184 [Mycena epipterygia]